MTASVRAIITLVVLGSIAEDALAVALELLAPLVLNSLALQPVLGRGVMA